MGTSWTRDTAAGSYGETAASRVSVVPENAGVGRGTSYGGRANASCSIANTTSVCVSPTIAGTHREVAVPGHARCAVDLQDVRLVVLGEDEVDACRAAQPEPVPQRPGVTGDLVQHSGGPARPRARPPCPWSPVELRVGVVELGFGGLGGQRREDDDEPPGSSSSPTVIGGRPRTPRPARRVLLAERRPPGAGQSPQVRERGSCLRWTRRRAA